MRKYFALILSAILLLYGCASSNSTSTPLIYAQDGVYNMTAQEYIDFVNAAIAEQGDSRYESIPAFVESGAKIEICYFNFTLRLTTNADGYITKFDYDWKLGPDAVNNTAPFIIGFTIGCMSPDENTAAAIWDQLDMMDPSSPQYTTEATVNGTLFHYYCYYDGVYSDLTISPESATAEQPE